MRHGSRNIPQKYVVSEKEVHVITPKLVIGNLVCSETNILSQTKKWMNFTRYIESMFSKRKEAYLTEKQHEVGKVVIDLDF